MFNVLIVDDEEDIREGLKTIIDWEKEGYKITGLAENGLQALELCKQNKFRLVITDVKMPGMDGLELIRCLRALDAGVKVLILSGYNDFSYAKEAMKYGVDSYLLKPVDIDELRRELHSIREELYENLFREREKALKTNQLRNYFLSRLVRGELPEKSIEKEAELYGIATKGVHFCVFIVELSESKGDEINTFENDIELKLFSMANVVEEIMLEFYKGIPFMLSDTRLGILVTDGVHPLEAPGMNAFMVKIADYLQKYLKQNTWIGSGNVVPSILQIAHSCRGAEKALEMRFYDNTRRTFHYSEINEEDIWDIRWSNSDLMNAVQNYDRDQINQQIGMLFAQFQKTHLPVKTILDILTGVIIALANTTIENGGNWDIVYKSKYKAIDILLRTEGMESIKQYVINLCLDAGDEINKAVPDERAIIDIIKYIKQNYNTEINLKKIANSFYMNPGYLGKLIKKESGKSFNDYLNEERISAAENLLNNTALPINEISERVGYKYIDHFYKNFKMITGTSPGEYRKKPV